MLFFSLFFLVTEHWNFKIQIIPLLKIDFVYR